MLKRFRQTLSGKKYLRVGFVIGIALLVIILVAGIYAVRAVYIKSSGIHLKPSRDYEAKDIQYFLQNDTLWANDSIGGTNSKMGGKGCLITCVASAVTDLGVDMSPKDINARLTAINGFLGADLIWNKINESFPEIDYRYSRVFSGSTIEKDLKSGLLPIINVKYRGNGVTHWLLVVGAKDGEFLVYDPLNSDKKPMPLSVHGKVYAYRVLFRLDAR